MVDILRSHDDEMKLRLFCQSGTFLFRQIVSGYLLLFVGMKNGAHLEACGHGQFHNIFRAIHIARSCKSSICSKVFFFRNVRGCCQIRGIFISETCFAGFPVFLFAIFLSPHTV